MGKQFLLSVACLLAVGATAPPSQGQPAHGIAMYGEPALPPDMVSLPHANRDAPKGGRVIFAETGGFDSLNPYILAGTAPWGVSLLTVQSLLARNFDEPFTLYATLAESVETNESRDFVEFTLREGARFSDESPVTIDDVIWSFETLGTEGHPRFRTAWDKVATMEATGPRSVRLTFTEPDRELPLILGLRPILQRAQFEDGARRFGASSLAPLIGSGPYVVDRFEPGRFVSFRRNPDWWGRDLPFNAGQHNLEVIRYDWFGDTNAAFEAFRAGLGQVLAALAETQASPEGIAAEAALEIEFEGFWMDRDRIEEAFIKRMLIVTRWSYVAPTGAQVHEGFGAPLPPNDP